MGVDGTRKPKREVWLLFVFGWSGPSSPHSAIPSQVVMLIPPNLSTRLANSRLWSLSHLWPRRFAYSVTDRVKTESLFNEQAVQPHCLTKVALSFVGTGTFPTAYRSTSCITLNLGKQVISLHDIILHPTGEPVR